MITDDSLFKKELMSAPCGIGTYLMLEEYVLETGDEEIFERIIEDYGKELPLSRLLHLLKVVYWENDRSTYQKALESLFRRCASH